MSAELDRAVAALERGEIVVLPTDTVYGIGALPRRPRSINAIYAIKGRPEEKPLAVLGASASDLMAVVDFDQRAEAFAHRFWPGPLTLVLPRAFGFDADIGGTAIAAAGVAVRVPACEPALALLRRTGPLAVTSANKTGKVPATTAVEARRVLGDAVDVVIDGGICNGIPSTVLSLLAEPEVLRRGSLDLEELGLAQS